MYISLHNHSQWSLLDSLIYTKELIVKAKELGQTAVALTDHNTMVGGFDSLKDSKKSGVKLIIGSEICFKHNPADDNERFSHIILIAKNAVGYKNILNILYYGYDTIEQGKKFIPVCNWELLEKYSEGVICLTACGAGIISSLLMQKKFQEAEDTTLRLKSIFGDDLGLEVQPNNHKRQETHFNPKIEQIFINRQIINLGKKHNIKVVPTNNAHFLVKEDHEIHDVLMAIRSKQTVYSNFRPKYTEDFYMKSEQEIIEFFSRSYGEDYAKEIVANTVYFADKCEAPEWIDLKYSNTGGYELAEFKIKEQSDYNEFQFWLSIQEEKIKSLKEDFQYFRYWVDINYQKLKPSLTSSQIKIYEERLNEEFSVYEARDFSNYVLITADFIRYAKQNGIPVGCGRGSGGGSLAAYFVGIHEADSVKHNLIFARFLNREKDDFPDFDVDFGTKDREKLFKYIKSKYGEEHVAHISNYSTITPKVYIRDLCRSLELGGSKEAAVKLGNEIADSVPNSIKELDKKITSMEDALKYCPLFVEYTKKYPELLKYIKIAGLSRSLSTHAAGVIISKRSLIGLAPLRKTDMILNSIEFEKERASSVGLIKIDFLGLGTLDIIARTKELVKQSGKEIKNFEYETFDEKAYKLFESGNTFGIFQFGTSPGTIQIGKSIKPKSIYDIANATALARPSAKDYRIPFIEAKWSGKSLNLIHPQLERALGPTYGCALFEECLMYIALDIAGWNLHKADSFRKLTKSKGKYPEKIKKLHEEFVTDSIKNGVDGIIAEKIWTDIILSFNGYGFNKSLEESTKIPVYDENGNFISIKEIKDFVIGEYVKSRDEKTKQNILVKVTNKYNHGVLPVFKVELDTGEIVKCTINHKFRVEETQTMEPLWKIIQKNLTII